MTNVVKPGLPSCYLKSTNSAFSRHNFSSTCSSRKRRNLTSFMVLSSSNLFLESSKRRSSWACASFTVSCASSALGSRLFSCKLPGVSNISAVGRESYVFLNNSTVSADEWSKIDILILRSRRWWRHAPLLMEHECSAFNTLTWSFELIFFVLLRKLSSNPGSCVAGTLNDSKAPLSNIVIINTSSAASDASENDGWRWASRRLSAKEARAVSLELTFCSSLLTASRRVWRAASFCLNNHNRSPLQHDNAVLIDSTPFSRTIFQKVRAGSVHTRGQHTRKCRSTRNNFPRMSNPDVCRCPLAS